MVESYLDETLLHVSQNYPQQPSQNSCFNGGVEESLSQHLEDDNIGKASFDYSKIFPLAQTPSMFSLSKKTHEKRGIKSKCVKIKE